MPLLPAVVPPRPSHTATPPTPERLARNVAPLFGVPWPEGPFEQRTWVCDYGRITLSEIARGAPLPTRTKARALTAGAEPATQWRLVERVAVTGPGTSLPHEIPNATLTRFGPDTKAAVVLVAANELLAPVTGAVRTALSLLVGADADLPVELGLAAWAGLVLEAFRSQPALVAAAIRARTIQRELVTWQLPLADGLTGLPLTRCEIGAHPGKASPPDQPLTLDVADRTFEVLQLPAEEGNGGPATDDPSRRELARRLLRQETVDLLLRRLLATGTPDDASHLWLSERQPGQLAVEAFIPPTALVGEFVRQAMRSLAAVAPLSVTSLPRVPEPAALAGLDELARRSVLIGLMSMLRQVQHSPEARELNRLDMVAPLQAVGALTRCLPPDDPVAVLTRCRVADMTVHMLRHDRRNELRPPLDDLRAEVRRVHELAVKGAIDRGAAAEAISSANVEINAVRWTNAADPDSGLASPDELHLELRSNWMHFHEALELASPATLRTAGYHLHNYASFLASPVPTGSTQHPDLARAVRLYSDVVIPARTAFFARTGSFTPLRVSLQVASRAAARLAEEALADGDVTTAAHFAGLGRDWVHRALAEAETERMLAAYPPTERAQRFALLAAPVLLFACEVDAAGATPRDVQTARRLVEVAQAWERWVMGENAAQSARHEELLALVDRLDALSARFTP